MLSNDKMLISQRNVKSQPRAKSTTPDSGERLKSLLPTPRYSLKHTNMGHEERITLVKYSPSGKWLASVSGELIKIWDAFNNNLVKILHEHKGQVNDVIWCLTSLILVSCGNDRTVRVWGFEAGKCLHKFLGHRGSVLCCTMNQSASIVASGGNDRRLRIWCTYSGQRLRSCQGHWGAITTVDFKPDGMHIISGSKDGCYGLWQAATGECLKMAKIGYTEIISHIFFLPKTDLVMIVQLNNVIKVWNIKKDICEKAFRGHINQNYRIRPSINNDCSLLICGSENGRICFWDYETMEMLWEMAAHKTTVLCATFHPTQDMIASSGMDLQPCLKVWKVNQELK